MHRAFAFALALVCGACASPPTQLIVVVDTDLGIPDQIDAIAIAVTGPDGTRREQVGPLEGVGALPSTLTVAPLSLDVLGPVRIDVSGRRGGTAVVSRRADVTLVRDQTLMVEIILRGSCVGVVCDADDTCNDGTCITAAVVPVPWRGSPTRLVDGGPVDAARPDVGPTDAGTLDAALGDAGPPTACETTDDCPPFERGPLGPCEATTECAVDGTARRNLRTFTCSGGECIPTDRTESEACTRSTAGTTCGATTCTDWDACTFGSTCATSGTQRRVCTDRACASGACGSATRMESQACMRSTDGVSCGTRDCGAPTACGYTSQCVLSGTQTRACTDHVCAGGACGDVPITETLPCGARTTEGVRCNSMLDCSLYECRSGTCSFVSGGCNAGEVCCYPGCASICP